MTQNFIIYTDQKQNIKLNVLLKDKMIWAKKWFAFSKMDRESLAILERLG